MHNTVSNEFSIHFLKFSIGFCKAVNNAEFEFTLTLLKRQFNALLAIVVLLPHGFCSKSVERPEQLGNSQ